MAYTRESLIAFVRLTCGTDWRPITLTRRFKQPFPYELGAFTVCSETLSSSFTRSTPRVQYLGIFSVKPFPTDLIERVREGSKSKKRRGAVMERVGAGWRCIGYVG